MAIPELIVRGIAVVVLAAAIVLAFLYVTQRSLIYFPGSASPGEDLLPPEAQVVELQTADGLRLSGWFLPAGGQSSGSSADSTPGPAVLICNGNAGDRSHRLPLAEALAERGYGVLLFDYRGYAGNPGKPTEEGLRADARAAVDALAARPDVDPERIAYFGESLGAAVAGGLATERPPAALVLRSPPSSLADVGRHHYPFLPIFDVLLFDRYPLAEQLRSVRGPLLVLVTERDEIVPAELSHRVFDAAAEPKRYVPILANHHNDPALFAGEEMLAAVSSFLDEWLAAE
ncbi:MAG TPA: alpha/beta hydrolase [Candidatus Limnocylindrales bacterium]|nr:alpha/beta hydrolase [Candidatus Limnocylindrales bacterium]